jgi:hypothetical protein
MDWEQITNGSYNRRYPRTVQDESEYQWHKRASDEMIDGIENYVKTLYIDPFEPYLFIQNRFGYHLADNIKHYLLWVNPRHDISDFHAEKIIRERFPTQEIHFIINPVKYRSIQGVVHYHVFIKIA